MPDDRSGGAPHLVPHPLNAIYHPSPSAEELLSDGSLGWKTVKPYMTAHPFNYAIAIGDTPSLIHAFGLVSLPKTLLIDRRGRIADAHTGVVDKAAWQREIARLLRER